MRVRCPHCSSSVDVLDSVPLSDIDCPSCGSSFSLVIDETITHRSSMPKQIGQFRLLEPLGAGAFGTVWKAEDLELQRIVALKIPRKGQLTSDETEKFIREARAVAQVKHPRIVSVHEVGRHDDTMYIVSDLVEGLSLQDWLTAKRPTHREAADLCRKIAEALDHAHRAGVIHRDLKPANIMLDNAGEPHIMDFGLAKREAAEVTMTVDGQVLGTPAYMSPEQARGEGHHADRRSDIYSLGVILYELLTGERPFRGNSRMLLHQVLHDEPAAPRKLDARIERDLETICLKCLEKNPDRRYQQAEDLAADLARWLHHEPISARPVGPLGRMSRWARRNPALAAMTALAAIGLIGAAGIGVAFGIYQWQTADELAWKQQQTQSALKQAVVAKKESDKQRNRAREQATIAKSNETKAKEARTKAEQAERLANERLSAIRRYLYSADLNLAQQAIYESGPLSYARAFALLQRHATVQTGEEDLRGFEWAHLMRLCQGAQMSLYRLQAISKVAYSPDNRWMAIAISQKGVVDGQTGAWSQLPDEIRIVESSSGAEVQILSAHPGQVHDLAFSADGRSLVEVRDLKRKMIFGSTYDLAVAKAQSGAVPAEISGMKAQDLIQGALTVGEFATDAVKNEYQVHTWNTENWSDCDSDEPIQAAQLACSQNGKWIAVLQLGIAKQEVFLREIGSDESPRSVWHQNLSQSVINSEHMIVPMYVSVSESGTRVAVGGKSNTVSNGLGSIGRVFRDSDDAAPGVFWIHVIDLDENSTQFFRLRGQPQFIEFSNDARYLSAAQPDGTVLVWHLDSEGIERRFDCPRASVATFSPDSRYLAVGTTDGKTLVFRNGSRQETREFRNHEQFVIQSVAFAPNSEHLATSGFWGLQTWNPHQEVGITKWRLDDGMLFGVAFASDNQTLMAIRQPWERANLLSLRSTMVQLERFDFMNHQSQPRISSPVKTPVIGGLVSNISYAGGKILLSPYGRADVIAADSGEVVFERADLSGTAALSPDGGTLTTTHSKNAIVWDANTAQQIGTLEGHDHPISCLSYSKDAKRLLTGDDYGDVWQWDLNNFTGKCVLKGNALRCEALMYTADENFVLYAAQHQLFRWDVQQNQIDTLTNAPVYVRKLELSPDGKTVVMLTPESVWLLDPVHGQSRLHFQHPTLMPAGIAFSNDSKTFAIGWRDQNIGSQAANPEVWIYHSGDVPPPANPNSAPSGT